MEAQTTLAVVCARRWQRDRVPGAERRARELLDRAAPLGPLDARLSGFRIEALLALNALDDAVGEARQLARRLPGDAASWRWLGIALARRGLDREAGAAFSRSLKVRHSPPDRARQSGGARPRRRPGGRQGSAARRGNDSPGLRAPPPGPGHARLPRWRRRRGLRGGVHRATDRPRRRRRAVGRLRAPAWQGHRRCRGLPRASSERTATTPPDPCSLGTALLWAGDRAASRASFADALALAEQHLAGRPASPRLRRVRALALAHLERPTEAILDIHDALRDLPDDPDAALDAARVSALSGDHAAALSWARRATELGLPRAWLQGPEFSALAGDPDFRELAVPVTPRLQPAQRSLTFCLARSARRATTGSAAAAEPIPGPRAGATAAHRVRGDPQQDAPGRHLPTAAGGDRVQHRGQPAPGEESFLPAGAERPRQPPMRHLAPALPSGAAQWAALQSGR